MLTLVIMDGFGISKGKKGNAILAQGTPHFDSFKNFPNTTLCASGESVGLSSGQVGNSEVGHLNMGAGKVVFQDLPKITNEIKNKNFFKNSALLTAIENVKKYNSTLHIIGLCSNGGVHSHLDHLYAIIDLAHQNGISNVCIHAITDGRDCLRDSGLGFIKEIEKNIKGKAQIKTVMGRFFAMDRENRYDRIEKAYDAIALGKGTNYFQNAISAIKNSYEENVFDECIEPCIIGKPQTIDSFDSVIFFNYRADRARQLTRCFTDRKFDKFQTKKIQNLTFCTMTCYDETLNNVIIAYPQDRIQNNLTAILSQNNKTQLHISETTKYAHVTFFFNGGIEKPYPKEERILIESDNVKNFAEKPNMKAYEITEKVLEAISSEKYDFILVNLSNADMLGHTGNFEATKKTIAVLDKCVSSIAHACLLANGTCVVTADHGNAEEMLDKKGNIKTSHTTNPVPFFVINSSLKNLKLVKCGALCNVAPTILKIMDIEIPACMEKPLF